MEVTQEWGKAVGSLGWPANVGKRNRTKKEWKNGTKKNRARE